MAIKIDKNIVDYHVKDNAAPTPDTAKKAEVIQMHERLERPEMLVGSTYKVKTPLSEHALYVTVNDVILNAGTEYELRRPFEVFINSKNMEHFQWIVALTRIISAVFRKGGDVTFLAEELQAVFDPRGGYFKKGGKYIPSLVAEIGDVLEKHMQSIGLLDMPELEPQQVQLIAEKRRQFEQAEGIKLDESGQSFPESAQLCPKCNTRAAVQMDGCMTCLNCGDSKCG